MPEWRSELLRRLASLHLSPAREAEIIHEFEQHLDDRYAEILAAGEPAAVAFLKALELELKGCESLVRELRAIEPKEEPGVNMLGNLGQDIRYASRMLLNNIGFAAVAILTLAIGIGSNTAVFTVVNGVMIRPLPYPHSEGLVRVREVTPQLDTFSVSQPNFLDWEAQNHSFEAMGAYGAAAFNMPSSDGAVRINGMAISKGLFPTLDVKPAQGRNFLPDEDRPGGNTHVAIISYPFWRDRFGRDSSTLGKTIVLSEASYTIVGIMPEGFTVNGNIVDVYVPLAPNPAANRADHRLNSLARLKPGLTIEQARDDMKIIAKRLSDQYPASNKDWGTYVPTLYETIVTDDIRRSLWVLTAAAAFVLLITCGNVANLLLARATVRQKEISIRLALGSGRYRVIRQLLIEALLMSVIGGVLGVGLAVAGTRLLKSLDAGILPRLEEIAVDWTILGYALAVSVLTGVLFGLAPAIHTVRVNLNDSLKEGMRGSSSGFSHRLRNALIVVEVALSVALLVGAGLLMRSFSELQNVKPGFNPSHVLTMRINLPASRYSTRPQSRAFYEQLYPELQALPGVQSVAIASSVPMGGGNTGMSIVPPNISTADRPFVDWRIVSTNYFKTLGISIHGREFSDEDKPGGQARVIISEEMARRYWSGRDPIGSWFTWDGDNTPNVIVGVAGDVQNTSLESPPRSVVYMPLAANSNWNPMIVSLRTDMEPATQAAAVRALIKKLDPNVPVFGVQTAEELIELSLGNRRFRTLLLGSFAATALILSCAGLFSVMAYAVSQRTHEIGIRLSLGARSADVFRQIIGRGMLLAVTGSAIGLLGAYFVGRWLKDLLFKIKPTDPVAFVGAVVVLLIVSLLACYVPARRATRVDPLIALRHE